ncbi:MAG: 30S ribosomal protein S4 [Candidatus Nealsonbacteria bacterium]|nr:30S ribosomal protein S4 [Candidatus Nealsonbacteria bacterium]
MENPQCAICRREGAKLFLKGDRCFSQKCQIVRRPFPPGPKRKRGGRSLSEYGKELAEKQKLRNWYNLGEREFKNYVKSVLQKRSKKAEDPVDLLVKNLETRLDNVVFRLGFGNSRGRARQLVSHGFFMVNGKLIDTPSYRVAKGDLVKVSPTKIKKSAIQSLAPLLKKVKAPSWLALDAEKLEGKVTGLPTVEETNPPAEISVIFEFYSR